MLVSKILRLIFRFKYRINNYIKENSDEIGFQYVIKFFIKYYCFTTNSFEDLMNNNKPKKRVIIFWTYYALLWIINIRFLLLAIINKPWIWTLFADPLYISGKGNLLALCSCGCICGRFSIIFF
jgi:hypothetical protein